MDFNLLHSKKPRQNSKPPENKKVDTKTALVSKVEERENIKEIQVTKAPPIRYSTSGMGFITPRITAPKDNEVAGKGVYVQTIHPIKSNINTIGFWKSSGPEKSGILYSKEPLGSNVLSSCPSGFLMTDCVFTPSMEIFTGITESVSVTFLIKKVSSIIAGLVADNEAIRDIIEGGYGNFGEGITIGDYNQFISGATIDRDGKAEFRETFVDSLWIRNKDDSGYTSLEDIITKHTRAEIESVMGDGYLRMEIDASNFGVIIDDLIDIELTATVLRFFNNISDDVKKWEWFRETGDIGNDIHWGALREADRFKRTITITGSDLKEDSTVFICEATVETFKIRTDITLTI